ncbi:hypothetical protein LCGC14_0870890 [marine sediment metagenome]|uniref:Uncharacterized protein n=1 Tax=marine sediment metagenome TaxID=412755 RepID=A0A0F9P4V1_9ZZZZ
MTEYLPPEEYFMQANCVDGCLNSVFEIENAMLYLRKIGEDIEHYKGLKKHRAQSIDRRIKGLEEDTTKLRNIILQTMRKLSPDQKTLNFPDVGKVSRRVSKDSWEIKDDTVLLSFFEKEGRKEEIIKIKESLDVRIAKKLIETYVESGVDVPGVTKIRSPESISISFEGKKPLPVSQPVDAPVVEETTQLDVLDL